MKALSVIIVFVFCCKTFFAQPAGDLNQQSKPVGKGNTYAVIVGISNYLDSSINLKFSNKDAVAFADFLMSASGGLVPKENIKLLLDADAKSSEVDLAIKWLKENCQKDDNVFFYFSGHGALENESMYEVGYLICYNTSSTAFTSMGLPMSRLNEMANTMSVTKSANVIIITDACHSGRIAKSKFTGTFLAGEQLMLAREREIRIASCKPEELSNEKTDWGGGRGVFSYHLINGLQGGLADADHNRIITLGELKTYLEHAMANDQVLKNDGNQQTPVIVTNVKADFPLSTVVDSEVIKVRQMIIEDSLYNTMVSNSFQEDEEAADPEAYFFSLLKKEDAESLTDNLKLNTLAADSIAFRLIQILEKRDLTVMQVNKLKDLESQLKKDSEKMNRFNISLAGHFIDIGQEVILHYIKGDEAELERRRYYSANYSHYSMYPKMLAVALKLSQTDMYYSTKSAMFLHYFSGVAFRLQIPLTKDPQQLIEQALQEQKKALALEEHAAYIYNELGILYQYKKEYGKAEKYFAKATDFSPDWAIPHSNLCGLYGLLKKYDKATTACARADSLQKNLQSVSINRGVLYERQGNQLLAEEYYRQAIGLNLRHYLPYERIAAVYTNSTDYNLADSFYYEASLRKKGYYFVGNEWYRASNDGGPGSTGTPDACNIDTSILQSTDIFAFFTLALQPYDSPDVKKRERYLKHVLAIDKKNPLAYHYLGKIYYDQQRWEEAELMFKNAITYYLDEDKFRNYVDSVKRSVTYPYYFRCTEEFFTNQHYWGNEDYYFAGTIYESWKHFEEAEWYFKTLIQNFPADEGGYIKLCSLLEGLGRYTEAEQVLKNYAVANKEYADRLLAAYYKRRLDKFPEDGEWNYRLGLLMYNRSESEAPRQYLDSIVWFPRLNKELFLDVDMFNQLDSVTDFSLADRLSTDGSNSISLSNKIDTTTRFYAVPGTYETITEASEIYTPRQDGIKYLLRAARFLSDRQILADIYFKIGNIYLWAGSYKQAGPHFKKSLDLMPGNANTRLKLVNIYASTYQNTAAMDQMNYLHDSGQINFTTRLLLAQFNIHAGDFKKGNELLDKTNNIYPGVLHQVTDLRGRLNMLANNPKEAARYYEAYLKQDTGNTSDWKKIPAYTLARMYAKQGKNKEAFKWLETAIGYGFNYSFVLSNDTLMVNLRKTAKWQTMISRIAMKKYKNNMLAN